MDSKRKNFVETAVATEPEVKPASIGARVKWRTAADGERASPPADPPVGAEAYQDVEIIDREEFLGGRRLCSAISRDRFLAPRMERVIQRRLHGVLLFPWHPISPQRGKSNGDAPRDVFTVGSSDVALDVTPACDLQRQIVRLDEAGM